MFFVQDVEAAICSSNEFFERDVTVKLGVGGRNWFRFIQKTEHARAFRPPIAGLLSRP